MTKSISEEEYEFIEGEGIPDCARIGYTEDGLEIFVGTDDPGRIPHFHCRSADRSVDTGIRILEARYFFLGKYRGTLDERQRRKLQEFMASPADGHGMTNWQHTAIAWNRNNAADVRIDGKGIGQPDYTVTADGG